MTNNIVFPEIFRQGRRALPIRFAAQISALALWIAPLAAAQPTSSTVSTGQPPAPTSDTLTLVSYNIHSGIPFGHNTLNYSVTPQDIQNIADVLTSAGADIVALQEVRNDWKLIHSVNEHNTTPIDIARLLAGYLDMHFAFGSTLFSLPGYPANTDYLEWGTFGQWTNNGTRHGEYGNAVLSRIPLVEPPENIALPVETKDEQRACLRVELAKPVGSLGNVIVYATHFQSNNGISRKQEMEKILSHATQDSAASSTVFILGDLNSFPHKGEADLIGIAEKSGFHDLAAAYAHQEGTTPANTIPAGTPLHRIDYILCNRPVKIINVQVPDTQVSDHRPVTVTISTVAPPMM